METAMADNGKEMPEKPEHWGEYSRMLGNLPSRPVPPGMDARLHARLDRVRSTASRPTVFIGAGFLAAAVLSLVTWLGVISDEGPRVPPQLVPAAEHSDQAPKSSRHRRHRVRVIMPKSGLPVVVDSVLPKELAAPRHPVITGQPDVRREQRVRTQEPTPGLPVPHPRSDGR